MFIIKYKLQNIKHRPKTKGCQTLLARQASGQAILDVEEVGKLNEVEQTIAVVVAVVEEFVEHLPAQRDVEVKGTDAKLVRRDLTRLVLRVSK